MHNRRQGQETEPTSARLPALGETLRPAPGCSCVRRGCGRRLGRSAAEAETAALGREGYGLRRAGSCGHTDLQVNEVGGSRERRTLLERPSACPRPPPPLDRMTPCV